MFNMLKTSFTKEWNGSKWLRQKYCEVVLYEIQKYFRHVLWSYFIFGSLVAASHLFKLVNILLKQIHQSLKVSTCWIFTLVSEDLWNIFPTSPPLTENIILRERFLVNLLFFAYSGIHHHPPSGRSKNQIKVNKKIFQYLSDRIMGNQYSGSQEHLKNNWESVKIWVQTWTSWRC